MVLEHGVVRRTRRCVLLPDFRKHLEVQARATRDGIEALLVAAVGTGAGELTRSTDVHALARTIETYVNKKR